MRYFYQHTLTAKDNTTDELIQVDGIATTDVPIKDAESYVNYRKSVQESVQKDGYTMAAFGTLTLLYAGE